MGKTVIMLKVKYNKISGVLMILLLTAEIIHLTLFPLFVPFPSALFQILLYATLALIFVISLKGMKVEWRMLLFVIFSGISLILCDADARYNAPARLMTWILLISAVGPLLYNSNLIRLRNSLFEAVVYIFMILGTVSFLYWLAGLPNLGRGHFTGIMAHSMLLAPIASLGGIYAFYRFFHASSWRSRYVFIALFIFNTIDVLLAASRSAFVGFVLGVLILIFFNKFKYRRIIISITILFALGTAINMNDTDTYVASNSSNEMLNEMESRGLENTREVLWNDRIREFKTNPFFGVGFASQDDKLLEGKVGGEKGNIEPGSTYLMILSMTGLFGTLAMILFLSKPLLSRKFWKRISSSDRYKLASFGFFSVHFLAEGYLFASGSLMAFVFWTLVGATYPYSGINYSKVLDKQ